MSRVLLKIFPVPNKQAFCSKFKIPGVPILVTHIIKFLVTAPNAPNWNNKYAFAVPHLLYIFPILTPLIYTIIITCNKVAKAVKQCSIHFLSVELWIRRYNEETKFSVEFCQRILREFCLFVISSYYYYYYYYYCLSLLLLTLVSQSRLTLLVDPNTGRLLSVISLFFITLLLFSFTGACKEFVLLCEAAKENKVLISEILFNFF